MRFSGGLAELACAPALALAALLVLTPACATTPPLPPRAVELNRDGAAALAAGDLATAEARIALAIEYSPRFTEAWVNLGLIEMRRGNFEQAHHDFSKARDLNPDLPAPHHALGVLADRRGNAREAEKMYRAALKVDPGFAPARANLGRLLFARGAWEDAREQYLRLTEVAPESLDGWLGLAESYMKLNREGEADETIARARARFGDVPEVVLLVARQLLHRDAFAAAEAALAPLTEERDSSRRAAAWAWIAVARASQHDDAGARTAADEALAIDPAQPVAKYVVAQNGGTGK